MRRQERLRIQYCVDNGLNVYVPKYKAADDGSVFCQAAAEPKIVRGVAPLPGLDPSRLFAIEGKDYPFAGKSRVLALAQPCS